MVSQMGCQNRMLDANWTRQRRPLQLEGIYSESDTQKFVLERKDPHFMYSRLYLEIKRALLCP
jgi:hypothetical protein